MSKAWMRNIIYIVSFFAVTSIVSCSDSESDILSKSEMEDILHDMHVAESMADATPDDNPEDAIMYRAAVLKKYDVTQAEWDSSFVYYCRHTEELHDIYGDLVERLQDEVELAGGSVSRNAEGFVGTDTTDVWNQENQFILMPYSPYNMRSFYIEADSSYHAGDRFAFRYDTNFLIQGGEHDVVVVVGMKLKNDSIVTQVAHKSQPFPAEIIFGDFTKKGIKSISGYIMLGQSTENNDATDYFRLVAVDKVSLLKVHATEEKKKDTDSKTPDEAKPSQEPAASSDTLPPPETPNGEKPNLFGEHSIRPRSLTQ